MNELEQSQQARRENMAKWRQQRTHELTLPSGLIVLVRDASVMDLLITGNVPQTLMSMIIGQAEGTGSVDLTQFSGNNEFGKLVTEMVRICVVDPPLADVADDEHLAMSELSGADCMEIFNHANREVTQVKSFRKEPAEPLSVAQPG